MALSRGRPGPGTPATPADDMVDHGVDGEGVSHPASSISSSVFGRSGRPTSGAGDGGRSPR